MFPLHRHCCSLCDSCDRYLLWVAPTLEVLRKLAVALSVKADELLFDESERGPEDDLRLQFEAVARLDPEEKHLIKELIEGILIKHESRRWIKREEAS